MSLKGTITHNASVGGLSIQSTIQRTASAALPSQEKSLPAADAGSLTTRTTDTAGTITASSGSHSIETGDVIDIFWTDANGERQCARGATVGTVSGTSIPFTGAGGTVLPAQDTAVTVDEQTTLDLDFDGDKLQMIVAGSTKDGHITFEDSGDAVLDSAVLKANEPYSFVKNTGQTNPLTGNPVDEIKVSNADSSAAATFKLGGLYDSDT